MKFHRRDLLAGTALFLLSGASAPAAIIKGMLPWVPNGGSPPEPIKPGPWLFFTGYEGRAVEALADRIIPPDPETPVGRIPGAPSSSTVNWPGLTAGKRATTSALRS